MGEELAEMDRWMGKCLFIAELLCYEREREI